MSWLLVVVVVIAVALVLAGGLYEFLFYRHVKNKLQWIDENER